MRSLALALSWLVFRSVVLFGQPVVGAEILSQPLESPSVPPSFAAPAVAMAKDRQGVAIAWAMRNAAGAGRIYVVRLDAAGQARGSIVEVATSLASDDVNATAPSIAASESGNGFTLAWLEIPSPFLLLGIHAVFSHLDGDLKPEAAKLLMTIPTASAVLARSGTATWLSAGGFVWKLRPDGLLEGILDAGAPASDMAATDPFPQVVSSRKFEVGYTCAPAFECRAHGGPFNGICLESCRTSVFSYALQYVALNTFFTIKTFEFDSDAQPAVQSDGPDVLLAWFRGPQISGGDVVAARLDRSSFANFQTLLDQPVVFGAFGPDSGPTRPDIATDGQRYLVVWRISSPTGVHDIVGSSIDRDGNVTRLSIATSTADERDPSVIAIGSGTFLVAYEKISNGERRIAGRFVTFGSRRRAAR